jgi:hypothetical protein
MTKAWLLRSGVKRKFHAPFCNRGRGREAPPYRNLGGFLTHARPILSPAANTLGVENVVATHQWAIRIWLARDF